MFIITIARLFLILYFCQRVNPEKTKLSQSAIGWSVVKDSDTISRFGETEPGFDLNDEDVAKFHIWSSGVIPYYIDDFSFDKVLRDRIRIFLERTNVVTGLHFMEIPRPPENDTTRWVLFINRQGHLQCADHYFKNITNVGVQRIVLGYNCLNSGEELAEAVLLLVGIPPQHNSPDRDNYVTISNESIIPEKAYLFEKLNNDEWLFHDVEYDFFSAGHYSLHKHTINGAATIVPKVTLMNMNIGESNGFSTTDIWKIRMLYNYFPRKQAKTKSIPECNKIFVPGSNISKYETDSEDEWLPRNKPNKYLNLSNDTNEQKMNANATDSEKEDSKKVEEKSEEQNTPKEISGENAKVEKLDEEESENADAENVGEEEKKVITKMLHGGLQNNIKAQLVKSDFKSEY